MDAPSNIDELVTKTNKLVSTKPKLNATAKFDLGEFGILYIDGSGDKNIASTDDKDADVTLKLSLETLVKMNTGELDGMSAFFQGLLEVEGDQSVAMGLNDLFTEE